MTSQEQEEDDIDLDERESAIEGITTNGEQYLTFIVANELFAISIDVIREIIEYRAPTTVPMMPSHVRGVINLRGRVVPVIDLSSRFGYKTSQVTKRTCIVILELYHEKELHYLGVVVDTVRAVMEIADKDIEPPPSFGANLRNDFIDGMGKIGDQFVVILDIEHVLSLEELATLTVMGKSSHGAKAKKEQDSEKNNANSADSQKLESTSQVEKQPGAKEKERDATDESTDDEDDDLTDDL